MDGLARFNGLAEAAAVAELLAVRHSRRWAERVAAGVHRLTFATGDWFRAQGLEGFYPEVAVVCTIADPGDHHHVPLLLSPYGYSTYRGS